MSLVMQQTLSTSSNFANPDAAYRMIVEGHRGLSDEDSAALDAALVLLLANHIGDLAVLKEALKQAAQTLSAKASAAQ
jgi:anthranilate phosphoribosyltransferase